jgi:hypothetical protein
MYYDREKEDAAKVLETVAQLHGDTNVVLLGGIMSALYDIASELHELNNKSSETLTKDTTRDSFEESIANGWIYG